MTKQKQADVLKMQQERERAKPQAEASKDTIDNPHRPMSHKPKGKTSHSDQIKSTKNGRRMARRQSDKRLP